MAPEYGDILFWEGDCGMGDFERIYFEDNQNVELKIDGLKEWFYEWDSESLCHNNNWGNEDWKAWWKRGLEFAKKVKALLPPNVELYYFNVKDKVWKVKPQDTDDGGIFNLGEPMKIE